MKTLVRKETFDLKGSRISVIDFPGIAISASYIRGRLKHKQTVLYMVPPAVNTILLENNYYTDKSDAVTADSAAVTADSAAVTADSVAADPAINNANQDQAKTKAQPTDDKC